MKVTALTVFAALALGAGAAVADEAKTPVSAAMILSIVSSPVESRRSAYDEALARPAPPAPDPSVGEVLPDGSVRYGKAIVTVKNPCPPG
ncbi:MAG TPA: hypothetical protein VEA38_23930, partial [Terriglobales bacterium]|nr:hypothetical protein [Terriglobales bacterium]